MSKFGQNSRLQDFLVDFEIILITEANTEGQALKERPMFEKALSAICDYCSNAHKNFFELDNIYPDGPILKDDGKKEISAIFHASLRQGSMKIVSKQYPSFSYTVWVPKVCQKKVKKAFPRNQNGEYMAEWIGVNYLGLCICGTNFWFLETCPQWE